MELQIKDNFIPNIGISKLKFLDNELIIKEKIGIPNHERIDVNDSEDYTINLFYESLGIYCFIHYENSTFSYTSFHLKNLFINNIHLNNTTQKECLDFLKDYHTKLSIEYIVDVKGDDIEKVFFFENIGLTIWFSEFEISDISIEPVW